MDWARRENRASLSWALYDWANSAFSTTIMAFFFPVFFKKYFSADIDPTQSSFYLGLSNSLAALALVFVAPFVGAIADAGSYKKNFVIGFTFFGAVSCVVLGLISRGQALEASIVYGLCSFFHAAALSPYDSLLVDVANDKEVDMVSAWGYSLGYLGGGLLFALNLFMLFKPELFGISDKAWAVKISFMMVGVWWLFWTLPFSIWVKEQRRHGAAKKPLQNVKNGCRELFRTCRTILEFKNTLIFLLAFFLYNDGVGTIIKMSVDYGMNLGFSETHLGLALLGVQFIGFPLTLVFGRLAQKSDPKKAIFIGIAIYAFVVLWAYRMSTLWEFYFLAAMLGVAQGGIQSVSRSLYARIIPTQRAGEFFGFYNLLGKFTGLVGPVMVGIVGVWTGNPRFGMLSILLLFVSGAIVLTKVRASTES
ncbi:MAG: MFS transporter [Proteobacteria bacterium]|nr:MFS transporter [Pseudomonadota bacterium]